MQSNSFWVAAMNMLNPVALFRSASRSSSSRFLVSASSASTSRDEDYESSSDFSKESSAFSGSHQSTLDRLFAWEKKLYQEVRVCPLIRRTTLFPYMSLLCMLYFLSLGFLVV